MNAPMVHYVELTRDDEEPGDFVGMALDELASWAIEHGCPPDEFIERTELAVERATVAR